MTTEERIKTYAHLAASERKEKQGARLSRATCLVSASHGIINGRRRRNQSQAKPSQAKPREKRKKETKKGNKQGEKGRGGKVCREARRSTAKDTQSRREKGKKEGAFGGSDRDMLGPEEKRRRRRRPTPVGEKKRKEKKRKSRTQPVGRVELWLALLPPLSPRGERIESS